MAVLQAPDEADVLKLANQFLLAMPGLTGDYFASSLIYVCEHNHEGALGLLVNRPSGLTLIELFAQLGLDTDPAFVDIPVLTGGPVSTEQGFVLHSSDHTFESSTLLSENLYMSTALDVLKAISHGQGPAQYLITLGYAGWAAGQLEEEIANNVWLTTPPNPSILFDLPYADRLNAAANTLGIEFSLIAHRPGHA